MVGEGMGDGVGVGSHAGSLGDQARGHVRHVGHGGGDRKEGRGWGRGSSMKDDDANDAS